MSLINEALKKAQRARADGTPGSGGPAGEGAAQIAKRAQPASARSMLLLVVGAVVLVVGSMVATALWLTRPISSRSAAKPSVAAVAPAPVSEAPAPIIVVPQPSPVTPPPAPAREPARTAKTSTPTAVASPITPPPATAAPGVATTPVSQPAADESPVIPKPAPKPDERIHQFVEAIRVAGIRSSGADSKVLMNDRVYRVNDIVDRNLGVRLTKVSADSLTFTDANGVTYVKYF